MIYDYGMTLFCEFSNYIMLLFSILFLVENFLILQKRRTHYSRQYVWLFLFHLCGYAVLSYRAQDWFFLFFFAFQQLLFIAYGYLYRKLYPHHSKLLLNQMWMLLCVGLMVISRISRDKALRQFGIIVLSLVIGMFLPQLMRKWKKLQKLTWGYGAVGLIAVCAVLLLGSVTNGSRISYSIAGITFQPSEFVKILFILFLAGLLSGEKKRWKMIAAFLSTLLYVAVLVLSKDLGSGAIFFVTCLFLLYAARCKKRYLGGCVILGAAGCVLAYRFFSHVRVRVSAWLNPFRDITGTGYQLARSLFAIGTGSWFGLGLLQGSPKGIPFVEADFIFSAVAEELGVLFSVCLILICLSVFLTGMWIARQTKEDFYRLTACGICAVYLFQSFLTIGGGLRFIPSTGVTLPLVSYGGSSVMATIFMFSILQGVCLIMREEQVPEIVALSHADGPTAVFIAGKKAANEKPAAEYRRVLYLSRAFLALFALLGCYMLYFMVIERPGIIDSPYNVTRQTALSARNVRGTIMAQNGEILAYTQVDEDGQEKRVYPYGRLFAHAVGYTVHGGTGIEASSNFALLTSHESFLERLTDRLNGERSQGDTIVTTLDPALQQAAYDALGDYRGCVIVLEPATGRVLAMVSKPDFDPNGIASAWGELSGDTENAVLLNRTVYGLYPPGSTFKLFTALAYIREHPENYGDYYYDCDGHYESDSGHSIYCYNHHAHGTLDFTEAFAYSCNSAFAQIGMSLDERSFSELLSDTLFGERLPAAFSGTQSISMVSEEDSEYDRMQNAIGQGNTLMSPLHLCMMTAAIGNGGLLMEPYMIEQLKRADGSVVRAYGPQVYGQLMSEEEADVLTEMMRAVCEYGTANRLGNAYYTAAGKTGSAEYEDGTLTGSHAWFTGFAPADNPQIAVTVILEEAGLGGSYAVPVAKEVFDAYFSE